VIDPPPLTSDQVTAVLVVPVTVAVNVWLLASNIVTEVGLIVIATDGTVIVALADLRVSAVEFAVTV
jgi:hypothetical protein